MTPGGFSGVHHGVTQEPRVGDGSQFAVPPDAAQLRYNRRPRIIVQVFGGLVVTGGWLFRVQQVPQSL
jgi:hypothetical protein